MSPAIAFTVGVIVLGTPLALWFARNAWHIVRDDPENVLARLLAAFLTAVLVGCVLLAIPTLFFVAGIPASFSGLFVLLALDVFIISALSVGGYLRWLKGKS